MTLIRNINEIAIKNFLLAKNMEKIEKEVEPAFKCAQCSQKFWSTNRLEYHINEIHEKEWAEELRKKEEEERKKREKQRKKEEELKKIEEQKRKIEEERKKVEEENRKKVEEHKRKVEEQRRKVEEAKRKEEEEKKLREKEERELREKKERQWKEESEKRIKEEREKWYIKLAEIRKKGIVGATVVQNAIEGQCSFFIGLYEFYLILQLRHLSLHIR